MPLESELKKIGFSDKEAKVYLALIELGEAPVQIIGQKAKVNRATTYVILESLKKQGIVSTVEKGKKTNFVAENPSSLLRKFATEHETTEQKEKEFKTALPELEALFNLSADKPRVRYFEGEDGMRALREDIIASGVKEVLDIYPRDETVGLYSHKENQDFFKKRTSGNITIRAIYTSEDGPVANFITPGERRFVPKNKFPFSADISIYGSRVAITTLRGKHITVIIENKEISDTMRLVFELAWHGADKFK